MKQQATRNASQRATNGSGRLSAKAMAPRAEEERTTEFRGSSSSEQDPAELEASIAERAYAIYLSRGDGEGDAVSDWLEAERQVRADETTRH